MTISEAKGQELELTNAAIRYTGLAMAKRIKGTLLPASISLDLNKADVVNPDGIRPAYSNNAALMIAPHDVRILFSEVVVSSPTDTAPKVELRANISMAPSQFKAFALAVGQTLASFEKQFGEIPWPPRNQ